MSRKVLDFRRDDRSSGIPRNYFLYNGDVINAGDAVQDASILTPPKPVKQAVKLQNSPDRAAALLFMPSLKRDPQRIHKLPSQEYHTFLVEGPRVTDGSYRKTKEELLANHGQSCLPRRRGDKIVSKIQR
jgi:hypothetical protein